MIRPVNRRRAIRYTPLGHVVTPTDIVIGGAYQRPGPAPSADAERIQAALLRRHTLERARIFSLPPLTTDHWILDLMKHPARWPVAFATSIAIGALLAYAKLAGLF